MRALAIQTSIALSIGFFVASGCDRAPPSPARLTVKLPAPPPLSPEQSERREKTRQVIQSDRIPFNKHLPGVEPENEAKIRTPREIAQRLIGLTVVAAIAQGAPKQRIKDRLLALDVRTVLTPDELAFFDSESPSDRERAKFSWSIEAAATLLWALGIGPNEQGRPIAECDVQAVYDHVVNAGLDGLVANSKPRSKAEILDALDLIYCYHWAVVDEVQINNRPVPGGLNPGVVVERHRALNWLVNYMDADWDDVSTDT